MEKSKHLLGAHISTEGGLHKALERGASINCTTIQIFTKSNRQWRAKELTEDEIKKFKAAQKETKITNITAHASYLINLGSPNPEVHQKSIEAMKVELDRCIKLDIKFLVIHPGARLKTEIEECLQKIASSLDEVLESIAGATMILLETTAGQGTTVGRTFEELATIRKSMKYKERIGICVDTCHIFTAGYNFSTQEKYQSIWRNFDQTIGLEHLKVFHINDSKAECGSHIDRHEHIGKGKIGLKGFELLMNDKKFKEIPKILETPKESLKEDVQNLNILENLISPTG